MEQLQQNEAENLDFIQGMCSHLTIEVDEETLMFFCLMMISWMPYVNVAQLEHFLDQNCITAGDGMTSHC